MTQKCNVLPFNVIGGQFKYSFLVEIHSSKKTFGESPQKCQEGSTCQKLIKSLSQTFGRNLFEWRLRVQSSLSLIFFSSPILLATSYFDFQLPIYLQTKVGTSNTPPPTCWPHQKLTFEGICIFCIFVDQKITITGATPTKITL